MKIPTLRKATVFLFFKRAAAYCAVAFCVFAAYYAGTLTSIEKIKDSKTFYILASEGRNVESCLAVASLFGGAACSYEKENGELAAVYGYFSKDSAAEEYRAVLENAANVADFSDELFVLRVKSSDCYLRTRDEKKQKAEILSAFSLLEGAIQAAENVLDAEENAGQEQLHIQAEATLFVLNGLLKKCDYKKKVAYWEELEKRIKSAVDVLKKGTEGILFKRDFRKAHAILCEGYLNFAKNFSL